MKPLSRPGVGGLPDDMNELYAAGATRIEGHATYGNFRRFETETRIKD